MSAGPSKSKRKSAPSGSDSDEGSGSRLADYTPPPGMEPLGLAVGSPFEFSKLVKKKGTELWAIRIPADLKASRLSALSVTIDDGVSGSLKTKSGSYRLSTEAHSEMDGMSVVVPSEADGKLKRAPLHITRRLILTPSEGETTEGAFVPPPKKKRTQPAHLLKFRNRAYGFDTAGPESGGEVAVEGESYEATETSQEAEMDKTPKEKRKKRKSDVESPKTKKKSK